MGKKLENDLFLGQKKILSDFSQDDLGCVLYTRLIDAVVKCLRSLAKKVSSAGCHLASFIFSTFLPDPASRCLITAQPHHLAVLLRLHPLHVLSRGQCNFSTFLKIIQIFLSIFNDSLEYLTVIAF